MEERIKELMESQHMNQQVFADFLGISSATLSSIFSKRTKVTLNTIKAIKDKYPTLNYSWLIDGVGPMFNDTDSSSAPAKSQGEAFIDFGDANDPSYPSSSSSESTGDVPPADSGSSPSPGTAPSSSRSASPAPTGSSARGQQPVTSQSRYGQNGAQNPNIVTTKYINNIRRSVQQILVIYDDQTCETFVPKK